MDKVSKVLRMLTAKERSQIKDLLLRIEKGNLEGLDTKKLKDNENIFRVRKGNWRIIFQQKGKDVSILTLERRSDNMYRNF